MQMTCLNALGQIPAKKGLIPFILMLMFCKSLALLRGPHVFAWLLYGWLSFGICEASTPGLPFTEDFSATQLQESVSTTAAWSTHAGNFTSRPRSGALEPSRAVTSR
jgi:hypothetical protein